jgi:hypothetical protein
MTFSVVDPLDRKRMGNRLAFEFRAKSEEDARVWAQAPGAPIAAEPSTTLKRFMPRASRRNENRAALLLLRLGAGSKGRMR